MIIEKIDKINARENEHFPETYDFITNIRKKLEKLTLNYHD